MLDHPSISRYHAALLWNPSDGVNSFILRDLRSTHGTLANKEKMPSGSSIKLSANNCLLSFGGSSRLYLLNSTLPDEPTGEAGCDWGQQMIEDVNQEEAADDEPEAEFELIQSLLLSEEITSSPNEDAFLEDPHKFLLKWFEQEGYAFQSETISKDGFFVATIQLPIEGRDFEVASLPQAKKKDALINACLFCCRILDKAKRLFPWQKTTDTRAKRNLEEEEVEEGVLDETVSLKKSKPSNQVHTFDSLTADWNKVSAQVIDLKAKLAGLAANKKTTTTQSLDGDSLDQFMGTLSNDRETTESKILKSKLRLQIKQLEKEQEKITKLLLAAKPNATLPTLAPRGADSSNSTLDETHTKADNAKCDKAPELSSQEEKSSAAQSGENSASCSNKDVTSTTQIKFSLKPKSTLSRPIVVKESRSSTPSTVNSIGESLNRLKETSKAKAIATSTSEDFVDWLPPENQDGTGRLSLNDKLGY